MIARKDVNPNETWNLQDLFATDEDYEAALKNMQAMAEGFTETYKGQLESVETIQAALAQYGEILEQYHPLSAYSYLSWSEDQANEQAQARASKFGSVSAQIFSQLSFLDSELLQLPVDMLDDVQKASPEFHTYIKELIRKQPYQLHPEAEKSLAAFSAIFSAPYDLYNTTKMVDLTFPSFTVNGEEHALSYVTFEGDWELETNTELRHQAFETFHKQISKYQHTTAKTYDLQLQTEKTAADLRGYNNVFDYLLFNQQVDRSLYERQIDITMKELAPHMRKYAKLLQKVHNLEQMTFADLKISLDPDFEPTISIDESKKYLRDSLSILGQEYVDMIDQAYKERWIDFVQNTGKATGAFCANPYGFHPYILISWTERMNEVFVLAHELGHAGHFYYGNKEQNVFNTDASTYFIEAPSTMNEMLVAQHLLQSSDDARFKRWVISSLVARTYYHNFVTHLLEAAYQREVYKMINAGGSVNASILNQLKRNVLEEFWGDAVHINEGAELTWMRQPHYYMGLYPYTYSAGLTISTQVSKRILTEGQQAVDDWMNVLKAAGSKTPVELAQMAGVDITTDQPLRDTIAYIGQLIDQLEKLTEELGEY